MDLLQSVRQNVGRFLSSLATPALPLYGEQPVNTKDVGKPPVYPAPNIATYINAYNTNATIYTILNYISSKFGNIPRYLYNVEDEESEQAMKWTLRQRQVKLRELKKLKTKAYGETAVDTDLTPAGKLAALTLRPNDRQGQDTYYMEAYLFYELTGEAFIFLNRGLAQGTIYDDDGGLIPDDVIAKMPVLEKTVLPSQFVNPVPSQSDINEIIYYKFEHSPGLYTNIRKVDMIHWKKPNPNYDGSMGSHLRGMSTLSAGLKLLTQDNSATDAIVAMQQNQGAKGLLINKSIPQPTPEQSSAIRNQIDTRVNNTQSKGAVGFLGGSDYAYLNFAMNATDLQLQESQQNIFIRLCNLFGVPPAIFLTETTYENLQQASKILLTNKILPAACSFRDEENRVLLPAFGLDPKSFTQDIDATVITELAEDMTALSLQLTNSPWLTYNEKREAMGNDRMEDENLDKIIVPNNLASLDDLIVADGLDSFAANSRSGNTDNPRGSQSRLHEQDNAEEGDAGDPGNAPAKRS